MAQAWIASVLAQHRPTDAILSEEAADVGDRATADRVWIIDPLDGTRQFAGAPGDWAVHVALTGNGKVTEAAVSLPARGRLFRSDTVEPADGPLSGRIATSRYASYEVSWVARELKLEPIPIGSAGAKAMAVVTGEADAYVHAGGQYGAGTTAPPSEWRWPPDCIAAGSTARRSSTNQPYPTCPISSSAARANSAKTCSPHCRDLVTRLCAAGTHPSTSPSESLALSRFPGLSDRQRRRRARWIRISSAVPWAPHQMWSSGRRSPGTPGMSRASPSGWPRRLRVLARSRPVVMWIGPDSVERNPVRRSQRADAGDAGDHGDFGARTPRSAMSSTIRSVLS